MCFKLFNHLYNEVTNSITVLSKSTKIIDGRVIIMTYDKSEIKEIFSYVDINTYKQLSKTNKAIQNNTKCSMSKIIKVAVKEMLTKYSLEDIQQLIICDRLNDIKDCRI